MSQSILCKFPCEETSEVQEIRLEEDSSELDCPIAHAIHFPLGTSCDIHATSSKLIAVFENLEFGRIDFTADVREKVAAMVAGMKSDVAMIEECLLKTTKSGTLTGARQ